MPFVRRLILGQNLHLTFSSKEKFLHEHLLRISKWKKEKFLHECLLRITKWKKEKFTFSSFESCNMCIVFFDLWMSRGGVDTFVLIIYFSNDEWEL